MTPASADAAGGAVSNLVVTAPRPAHRSAFHELLSELNPLQYLPVVGTIYRAVTGDRISDEARTVGSLVMSGLTGGPAGMAISAALMAVEKVIGVDPEKLGQGVLAEVGIGPARSAVAQPTPAASGPASSVADSPAHAASCAGDQYAACAGESATLLAGPLAAYWSPAQLAAYGVTTAGGTLRRGSLKGADVLNDMELASLTPGTSGRQA